MQKNKTKQKKGIKVPFFHSGQLIGLNGCPHCSSHPQTTDHKWAYMRASSLRTTLRWLYAGLFFFGTLAYGLICEKLWFWLLFPGVALLVCLLFILHLKEDIANFEKVEQVYFQCDNCHKCWGVKGARKIKYARFIRKENSSN